MRYAGGPSLIRRSNATRTGGLFNLSRVTAEGGLKAKLETRDGQTLSYYAQLIKYLMGLIEAINEQITQKKNTFKGLGLNNYAERAEMAAEIVTLYGRMFTHVKALGPATRSLNMYPKAYIQTLAIIATRGKFAWQLEVEKNLDLQKKAAEYAKKKEAA